jgi:hypothetical protein
MEEWQKAVFSSGVGFIAGLLAEPIKARFASRLRRTELQNAIDKAMSDVCGMLFAKWKDHDRELFRAELPFDRFEHYFKQQKADFYEAVDSWLMVDFFERAKPLILDASIDSQERTGKIEVLLKQVITACWNGDHRSAMGKYTRRYVLRCIVPEFPPSFLHKKKYAKH